METTMNTTQIFPITTGFNKDNLISSDIIKDKDIPSENSIYDEIGLKTNYIKPGKILNLLAACQGNKVAFCQADEILQETLKVVSVLIEHNGELSEHNVDIPFIKDKGDVVKLDDHTYGLDITFNQQTKTLDFKQPDSKVCLGVLMNIGVMNTVRPYA